MTTEPPEKTDRPETPPESGRWESIRRRIGKKLSAWAVFLTVVATALTVAAWLWRLNWRLELASNFHAHYAAMGLMSAVILWRTRRRHWMWGALAVGCVNLVYVAPLYAPWQRGKSQGETVRAAFLNVMRFNSEFAKVAAFIEKASPDFFVMTEVTPDAAEEFAERFADYAYRELRPDPGYFGIALFSRFPIVRFQCEDFPDEWDIPCLVADLDIDGTTLTVIGTHLCPPIRRELAIRRNRQIVELAKIVCSESKPCLMLADLNMACWSPHFRAFVRNTGLRNTQRGFGLQATLPAFAPGFRTKLDHALASPEISIARHFRGPRIGSDHLPIVVDFCLSDRADSETETEASR